MAQPTVAEVMWYVDLPDSRAVNVFHYDKTGTPWAVGDAAGLATVLQAPLLLDWVPVITIHCTIIRCIIRILNASFDDEYDSGALSSAGTVSDSTFPAGTVGVLKKLTDEPGRKGQGRLFISGLAENAHTDSKFNATGATWTNLMTELGNSYVAGPDTFIPSVWSRKNEALYPITNITSNPVLGHLRGRRPAAF